MPTRRFGKVRRLLKSGRARVVRRKPFTIQLLYDTTEYRQPLRLGLDPGSKKIGLAVRRQNGEVVYAARLQNRTGEVTVNMSERQMHRRSRRRNKREKRQRRAKKAKTCFMSKTYKIAGTKEPLRCVSIKPKLSRFHNRVRVPGWLTPTARHLQETHKNFIENIRKILPITQADVEYAAFDIHKLEKPEVKGEGYQKGRKKGSANTTQYVLCRDKHTCQLCGRGERELHVHHVIWRQNGGGDVPENMITLCSQCHSKVHKNPKVDKKVKDMFQGMKKRYVHATLLNTIMPSLFQWLESQFAEVKKTYGYETKEKRRKLGWLKDHHIDAYLTTLDNAEKVDLNLDDILVYEFMQFRRHHRQITHAVRDRNYKDGKKIVAKNRRKRTGQSSDSLAELLENKGRKYLHSLRVLPGKKVKRSAFNEFAKGDVVRYKGKTYVVKGYGEMGRSLGFVNEKKYVPSKDCQLVIRNTGIVCL